MPKSNIERWREAHPEEWKAHLAKLRRPRGVRKQRVAAAPPQVPEVAPPEATAVTPTIDSNARFLPLFQSLLGRYLDALALQSAWGIPNPAIQSCRLCAGTGIHFLGCNCLCHETRRALEEFIESQRTVEDIGCPAKSASTPTES